MKGILLFGAAAVIFALALGDVFAAINIDPFKLGDEVQRNRFALAGDAGLIGQKIRVTDRKSACGVPKWATDQFCDDENNNVGCNWDGGACCNNKMKNWDYYCKDCECLESGQDFPTITPGIECLDNKIGIIGGGPAGVHMAYRLKQKGFTNVTILEKSNRIGGKAELFTYRDTKIPLAVLSYTSVYNETLLPLLRLFGIKKPNDSAFNYKYATYWPVNNDSKPATNYPSGSPPTKPMIYQVKKALEKYEELFYQFFGQLNNRYGLMKRPSKEVLAQIGIGKSIMDFLTANNIMALKTIVEEFFHINGYGTLGEVPAIYLFIWANPQVVRDSFEVGAAKFMTKRSIPELFPIMVEKENLKVEYNFEVINIKKEDEKFKLESFNGDQMEFDDIFWAVPLPDFQRVADKSVLYKNGSKSVEQIIKSSAYTQVASSMVDAKDLARSSQNNIFTQNLLVPKFNNNVILDFDFPAVGLANITREDYVQGNFLYPDGRPPIEKWFMWVVQYGSVYEKKPSLIELRDNLKAHYKNFNGSDIEVLYTRTFDYFPRFNMTAASKGYHWDLYDMQGKLNLYFIGGGCSFESVHNVIGYNNLLLDHMPMPAKNCSAL